MLKNSSAGNAHSVSDLSEELTQVFFKAIQDQDANTVRQLLMDHNKTALTQARWKAPMDVAHYPSGAEVYAFRLLGAYLGPLTGLQFSILIGQDGIAKDILDATFVQDIDATYGGGNTALQMAVVLEASTIIKALLERGADKNRENDRGFSALSMASNPALLGESVEEEGEE
ncbi:hypothetical protein EMPS_01228 [Entomortierella parvispora]|uniref:Ankyrin n=1 Tax=Entomortierella parvispora TaxID=205924 RepID=A0A9P3H361_9FUNG|nr:hypothetical protein EMPS_01228 [Entomortierella parvispora]